MLFDKAGFWECYGTKTSDYFYDPHMYLLQTGETVSHRKESPV